MYVFPSFRGTSSLYDIVLLRYNFIVNYVPVLNTFWSIHLTYFKLHQKVFKVKYWVLNVFMAKLIWGLIPSTQRDLSSPEGKLLTRLCYFLVHVYHSSYIPQALRSACTIRSNLLAMGESGTRNIRDKNWRFGSFCDIVKEAYKTIKIH